MEFMPDGPMAIPMWINGRAYLTVSEAFFDVVNPVTGQALRRVPLCGHEEAAEAVAAARAAQPSWAEMGLMPRRVCLSNLATALDNYRGHFAKLLVQDLGIEQALAEAEVDAAVDALRGGEVGETGVFALVLDAERSLANFAEAITPALMAGATLVVKPSPKAPSAIYALCELTARNDWPGGVVNVLQGDRAAIEGLCAADIDRVVYVGRPELGTQVEAITTASERKFVGKTA